MLDGAALEEGVIRFRPTDGNTGPMTSAVIEAGLFELDAEFGPFVGQHIVEIESTDDGGYAMDDEDALNRLAKQKRPKIEKVTVPAMYSRNSPLRAEVSAEGPNSLTFDLATVKRGRR